MQVAFLHHRTSAAYQAEVDPGTTGETCIQSLIDARFIEPNQPERPYSLIVTRTQKQLLPATSMQEAEVVAGDSIAIQQMEQGASSQAMEGRGDR